MRKFPLGQAFEDGLPHFFGSHRFSSLGKVAGTKAGPYGFLDRLLDGCSRFFEPEAVAEHEAALRTWAQGLAKPFPAMSGAVPPAGS